LEGNMRSSHAPEITRYLEASRDTLQAALADASVIEAVAEAAQLVIDALRAGKKVLIAGNGGSAADAQHLATELMVRYYIDRAALPAIALGTDASANTAIGNDLGFESLFSRQIAALGSEGDVFMALSTSGRSPNILAACKAARTRHMRVIGFTGMKGGAMDDLCDILIRVPSDKTPLIQQTYMAAGHALCEIVERELANTPG
jgi:D-sedoheptulose 7-phosphate isomerase